MARLYHVPLSPFCRKVRLSLAEKRIEVELVEERYWEQDADFLRRNPAGKVPVIRLDDYFGGELMPTHVKIDTEGFEYQVLLGARKILETRPVLFIEVHEKMTNFGYDRKQLYTFLSDSGYRLLHLRHRKDEAAEIEVTVEQMMELSNSMVICEPR